MLRRLSALELASLLVAAVSLFAALGAAELWDPPEVENAELARRIAEGLFGAGSPSGGERVPTRGELGKGELPYLAMAWGFRWFGLAPWAARLPLALFGAAGVLALFVAVRRLASRRAACVAVLALSTTPLYYLQARSLLGDITTLAATVLAFAGYALFVFDEHSSGRRLFGLGLALLGGVAGFFARGPLLGVAPGALGVGVTWLALSLSREEQPAATRRAGAITLATGLAALASGGFAWLSIPSERYSFWIGATRSAYPHATFEAGLRTFLHAGFPWSALALPALGHVLVRATREPTQSPRSKLAFAAVMTAVSAWAIETALTPALGPLPGSGLTLLAVVVGLALDERPPHTSRGFFGASAGLVGALLLWDFFHHPDKLLASLGAPPGTLPETWDRAWFGVGAAAALTGFGVAALFLAEPSERDTVACSRLEYARWVRVLLGWRGGLTRLVTRRFRTEPGTAAAWVLALLGLSGSLALAPALSFELTENATLAAYRSRKKPGDELGLLHGALPAARYQRDTHAVGLGSLERASAFLDSRRGGRRFIALAPSELGPLNAVYRARSTPRRDLGVVQAGSEAWLVVERLDPTELDLNPLRAALLDAPPSPSRELDAELGQALGLVGWELRDREGVVQSEVIAGEWYDLYLFFEVRARLERAWRIFVHVDGFQQRFNADHEPLGSSYSTDLWLPGDWVVDRHRLRVDTELAAGSYSVYAGMHIGEERLPVTRGTAGADRIFLGALRVH